MRVMAKITTPVEAGNRAINQGKMSKIIQATVERWKPEAIYFCSFEGKRTVYVVFDMAEPSDMVPFGEQFFMELNADVVITPVMVPDDLQTGFAKLG